ncbi:MAG: metallophosphoesterase [Bacteroidota bacterium]
MKIVQITDLHIDQENEFPHDIDVRKNLKRVLRAVRQIKADHLVVSGDLCYDVGDTAIYEWIKEQLDLTLIPYDVIGGNHDDSLMMAEVFGQQHLCTDDELYFAKKVGKTTCIFLDSAKGFHSEKQLKWLKRQLNNNLEDILIFTHHPPVKAGVPFMDNKYPLRNIDDIQKVFASHRGFLNIFCGHYHVEKSIQKDNILVQITPSCFFQIDQNYEDFKVDHHSIAYRLIDTSNNSLKTSVKYFRGSKK